MLRQFTNPDQLVKEDSGSRLALARPHILKLWGVVSLALAVLSAIATLSTGVLVIGGPVVLAYLSLGAVLIFSDRTITFDASQQIALLSTRLLFRNWRTRIVPFAEIASVYLDFEEHHYYSLRTIYTPREKVSRKWLIFLVLHNRETITVARLVKNYPLEESPNLAQQTVKWEHLAHKICTVTNKLLVRTPTVPGRAPHTFVDIINQIAQRQLAALPAGDPLKDRSIRLRSHPSGAMEIIIDGVNHRKLDEIAEPAVRELIQAAIDEWHSFAGSPAAHVMPNINSPTSNQTKDRDDAADRD